MSQAASQPDLEYLFKYIEADLRNDLAEKLRIRAEVWDRIAPDGPDGQPAPVPEPRVSLRL